METPRRRSETDNITLTVPSQNQNEKFLYAQSPKNTSQYIISEYIKQPINEDQDETFIKSGSMLTFAFNFQDEEEDTDSLSTNFDLWFCSIIIYTIIYKLYIIFYSIYLLLSSMSAKLTSNLLWYFILLYYLYILLYINIYVFKWLWKTDSS